MSGLGRLPWGAHLAVYPAIYFLYKGYSSWSAASAKAAQEEEISKMAKARPVDPDLFNPFTPIPFHNNPELKYYHSNVDLVNYISRDTHYNVADYPYKTFHDSYDQNGKKTYLYNYTNVL